MEECVNIRNAKELMTLAEHYTMLGWKSSQVRYFSYRGVTATPTMEYPKNFADNVYKFPISVTVGDGFVVALYPVGGAHKIVTIQELVNRRYYTLL
jgi:hypothetical protein